MIGENFFSSSFINKRDEDRWGYQDFAAGEIIGTSVTLTRNDNGIGAYFHSGKIIGGVFRAITSRSDNPLKYVYSGSTALFSTKIKVNSIVGAAVVLNAIPYATTPVRIWYRISTNKIGLFHEDPPPQISSEALTALDDDLNILVGDDVINNLTSTDINKPLSANMGKSLEENKQPLDATLTALSGLDATAGVLKQTGADTFTKALIVNADVNNAANIATTKLRQETIVQVKSQPANNDTLDVVVNKLLGLNNSGSSAAPLTIANLPSGGAIGTAAATVDINNVFLINQTTTGQTITLPNPTNATLSQTITLSANSTASFIAYGNTIAAGSSASFLWNGSAWSSIGVSAGAGSNKPPLLNFINASDITISGSGTTATITWTAQSNAVRYKVFAKQTSFGAINIITDEPVATVNAPTNFVSIAVNESIGYTYAVLVDKSTDATTDIINFTTTTSISNFTLDTFDLSAGTTATLTWSAVAGATEYRIQYQRATSLSSPTIISGITATNRTITGLTPSNPDDATTPYSFKLIAYNSGGQQIAETPVITRPVFANINLRYFYDSATTIAVSSLIRSGDFAIVITTVNHGFKQGDVISITNAIAPFNVSYALVFDTPTLISFRYIVANSGATSSNTAILQKFENPFITWSYYKFRQYLSALETATKKILPRNPIAYTLSTTPVNYTAELIFAVAKYQNSGNSMAGWYLIKCHSSDDAIAVLADATNKNVAMQMFDGTFSYSDRQDKFLFAVDDHRGYKLWHGRFAYLQNTGTNDSNFPVFYKLNYQINLSENSFSSSIENRPSELSNVAQAMPIRLSLSGYTIYFDNDNQRLIIQKKDGTRKIILTYSALGMSNIWGFLANVGGGTQNIGNHWYAVTNNLDTIMFSNRLPTSAIGSYRLIFNFDANTVNITSVSRLLLDSNLFTEENCFGDQIDTYFNLRTNAVQAVRYFSGSPSILTLRLYSTPLTDLTSNTTDLNMIVPGDISSPGMGPVSIILSDGSIYWIDWGHDDRGMYRLTGSDDGLGIVKMANMSVHPRLLPII